MRVVFDVETDGLLDQCTKIHCLCFYNEDTQESGAFTNYADMIEFLNQEGLILVGHNIVKFDIPVLKKILKIEVKARAIDTLGLSWVLQPKRKRHGLEGYGEEFGILKPEVTDWSNLSVTDYVHRCSEDVKINTRLWFEQYNYLMMLYDGSHTMISNFIKYIELKLTCVAEQEQVGIRLDIEKCKEMIAILTEEKERKVIALTAAMPKVKNIDEKTPPKIMYKKDGSLSSHGLKWIDFLDAHNLPHDHTEPVPYLKSVEEPNPNSVSQKKDWLYSLGWIPEHIKFDRNKETGEIKEIPQIKHKDADREGEVCDSIKKLFTLEPALEILEGLTIITHRIGLFEGFLRDQKDGRLHPGMSGFTNTMRLKHTVIVNLPKVTRMYGKEVRGVLIADEGKILCGSDLSNIESTTRNHYIFPYDPEYVAEMSAAHFDSHLDIAKLAGFLTHDQVEAHLNGIQKFSEERQKGKTVNFAAVYGVGAATLHRNSGLPLDLCKKLLETYWRRNWAVKRVAETCYVKTIGDQMWLYNPISKFYYSLRAEKDRFSTLNQGSAVYVFDVWMSFLRKLGVKSCLQMHDETLFNLNPLKEQVARNFVQRAIDSTNQMLKLNVTVGCSADFGFRYSDCH